MVFEGRMWTTLDRKCFSSLWRRTLSQLFFFLVLFCKAIIEKISLTFHQTCGHWLCLKLDYGISDVSVASVPLFF